MNEGFIFNHNRCVACGACSAACMIENRWTLQPRMIYTYNSEAVPSLPVINLSLACNHCKKALCMEGCPATAFHRDAETGAIVIDDSECIGCRYCQWNCPYDAPKYVFPEQVIGKCHLCHQRLREELDASLCNCLSYRSTKVRKTEWTRMFLLTITWFPDKNLEPSLLLTGNNFAPTIISSGAGI